MDTIAIIGGGIGGLASAILLARKGFHVSVFDKAATPQPVGAGFLLQPPGQAVLQKLGVLDSVLKYAVPISGLQSKTVSGRTVLDLDYSALKTPSYTGLGVQRNDIYQALLSKVLSTDRIKFHWGNEVTQCMPEVSKVTIVSNNEKHDFDLCILSSGANSILAYEHFSGRIHRPYGWGCLWTTIDLPQSLAPNILHQRCKGSSKMMGILPVQNIDGNYQAALYWSMKSSDIDGINGNNFGAVKNEIEQFWPDAKQSIASLQFHDFISAKYNDVWTPKPYNNRLVALGDICHATSPQLGQGCTMALLDAWVLSMQLNQNDDLLLASLDNWWAIRRNQLAYVRHLSKLLTPLFQSDSKALSLFRDWLMAPIGRLPLFNNLQLSTLASDVFLNKAELKLH
ncbi:NAD(P)/FAD-dependent oxidoreductase [Alteromonas sp. KUL49]|uniref:FAD-dependent oxidoreductase n=1 Tax=Alteromonas sp. KUL49 TaxID=2480798 RepID=UPI00102F131A|nr:NAD(P)/FAD-dependent oxidoreductase [Alteromonas sp. KUL49]TAP39314.1 FAD-dependent monooxygenase [Alteromonas sp. KUL49]GEA12106.1 oxidoreductase [Alteromonas sp. KUL49]